MSHWTKILMAIPTIEAAQAHRCTVTLSDAGGVLEFVSDGENGYVLPPDPKLLLKHLTGYLPTGLSRERWVNRRTSNCKNWVSRGSESSTDCSRELVLQSAGQDSVTRVMSAGESVG